MGDKGLPPYFTIPFIRHFCRQALEQKLNTENAMFLFDRDLVKKDDLAGMCIVPCKDNTKAARN